MTYSTIIKFSIDFFYWGELKNFEYVMDSGFFVKIQKYIMISCQKKVLSLKYARMSHTVILTFFISSYEANKNFFFLKGRKFNFNVIKFTNWCSRLPFFSCTRETFEIYGHRQWWQKELRTLLLKIMFKMIT